MNQNSIYNESLGWDMVNWKKLLIMFEEIVNIDNLSKVLELGAGFRSGGLSYYFALKQLNVVCSDYPIVQNKIKEIHRVNNLDKIIKYEFIDALDIPYNDEFDLIAFKSMLGGIGKWNNKDNIAKVIDNIHKALKDDGYIMFAENMQSTFIHNYFRNQYGSGRKGWTYLDYFQFIDLIKSRFRNTNFATSGFLGCFGQTAWQRRKLGLVDQFLFKHIIPQKFNYIFFCIAQK